MRIINGYSAGTKLQICSYLTLQYGGFRNFGLICGFMNSLIAGTAGCRLCGFLLLTLPRYPDWKARQGAEAFA